MMLHMNMLLSLSMLLLLLLLLMLLNNDVAMLAVVGSLIGDVVTCWDVGQSMVDALGLVGIWY